MLSLKGKYKDLTGEDVTSGGGRKDKKDKNSNKENKGNKQKQEKGNKGDNKEKAAVDVSSKDHQKITR